MGTLITLVLLGLVVGFNLLLLIARVIIAQIAKSNIKRAHARAT